jgi:hypothetical protein
MRTGQVEITSLSTLLCLKIKAADIWIMAAGGHVLDPARQS